MLQQPIIGNKYYNICSQHVSKQMLIKHFEQRNYVHCIKTLLKQKSTEAVQNTKTNRFPVLLLPCDFPLIVYTSFMFTTKIAVADNLQNPVRTTCSQVWIYRMQLYSNHHRPASMLGLTRPSIRSGEELLASLWNPHTRFKQTTGVSIKARQTTHISKRGTQIAEQSY